MRIVLDAESEAAAYRNVGMGPEAEAPPVRLSPWGHRQRGRGTRKDVPAGNGTGRSQGQLLPQHAADTECSQCCGQTPVSRGSQAMSSLCPRLPEGARSSLRAPLTRTQFP